MSTIVAISLQDGISPFLQAWLKNNPRFIRSATKSVGWYVQREIKGNIDTIAGGWKERVPYAIRKRLSKTAPKSWLGKMRRAIGYQYIDNGVVNIGWTSKTSAYYGRIQEEGTTRPVTDNVREFYRKRGVALSERKTQIRVPARPIYEPAMQIVQPGIVPHIENKVANYIKNGGFTKTVTRRKYTVYK